MMDEYNEFYDDKLRPMVRNAGYNNGKEVNVTPEKLRYIAHEILLFLGDDLPIGWIPVTERLPEDHDTVLFYCRSNYSNIGYHVESAKQWTALPGFYYHGKMYKLITHWQPLPASPEDANA